MRVTIVETIAQETWHKLVTLHASFGEALAVAELLRRLADASMQKQSLPASPELPETIEGEEG